MRCGRKACFGGVLMFSEKGTHPSSSSTTIVMAVLRTAALCVTGAPMKADAAPKARVTRRAVNFIVRKMELAALAGWVMWRGASEPRGLGMLTTAAPGYGMGR